MNKVIIAGSRDFDNFISAEHNLLSFFKAFGIHSTDIEIISGGARGADKIGEQFAKKYNIKLTVFPAQWDKYGKSAGMIRNAEMAQYAKDGILFAFWDGKSTGTKNMIDAARRNNMTVLIYEYKKVNGEKMTFVQNDDRILNIDMNKVNEMLANINAGLWKGDKNNEVSKFN